MERNAECGTPCLSAGTPIVPVWGSPSLGVFHAGVWTCCVGLCEAMSKAFEGRGRSWKRTKGTIGVRMHCTSQVPGRKGYQWTHGDNNKWTHRVAQFNQLRDLFVTYVDVAVLRKIPKTTAVMSRMDTTKYVGTACMTVSWRSHWIYRLASIFFRLLLPTPGGN